MDAWVERVLNVKSAASGTAGTGGTLSVMKLGKARVEWIGVRRNAVGEIGRLREAIRDEFQDDEEQAAQLEAALAKLGQRIDKLDPTLEQQLDVVLNAAEAARPAPAEVARRTLQDVIDYLQTDEVLAEVDGNEVLPDIAVVGNMRAALGNIAAALGLPAQQEDRPELSGAGGQA